MKRIAAIITTSIWASGFTAPLKAQLLEPRTGLNEVSWSKVKLESGFWGPRLEIHHKITIPHVLEKLEENHHIANFDVAAMVLRGVGTDRNQDLSDQATKALEGNSGNNEKGVDEDNIMEGQIVGHSAFDSDLYKALEGACYTLAHKDDAALRRQIEAVLERILAAQEQDGYLVSYFTAKEPENKWVNMRLNHEDYNAGHFFEFAVAHHLVTGKDSALNAAKHFADHIDGTFGPGKRYDVGGHQEIELALIRLYRLTGIKRYLELSRFFIDERGHAHGTERKPFIQTAPPGPPKRLPDEDIQTYRHRKWSTRNGRMQDRKPLFHVVDIE